tara:strand:- start:1601 stop:2035 length:435 start_codon:yes stop_codon:yes gene_type:complete
MFEACQGCQYEEYPYKAQIPVIIDGNRPVWEFKSDEDVWKVVDLIIEEINESNSKGNEFDIVSSIQAQLPFFTCRNALYDKEDQKDIQRYLYCEKFNIPAYKGSYGEQPCLWVDKAFVIRNAFAKLEKKQINKAKQDGTKAINN